MNTFTSRQLRRIGTGLAALALLASGTAARGDNFGTGGNSFSVDFVTIPGATNPGSGYGIVTNDFRIGKFEITADQWTKFVNSLGVSVNGSPWYAYDTTVAIFFSILSVAPPPQYTSANVPMNCISWYQAAQFVNWLNTSTGHQAAYNFTSTQGSSNYTLTTWPAADAAGGTNLYRHKDAYYFLPSEDEWVKAAYWNGTSLQSNATVGNSAPTQGNGTGGTGWNFYNNGYATTVPGLWAVGSGSLELNGTHDMMGNAAEWTESPVTAGVFGAADPRSVRGGSFSNDSTQLASSARGSTENPPRNGDPACGFDYDVGFRIASIVPPPVLTWSGGVSNLWDVNTTANFDYQGAPATFLNGDTVVFNDTGTNTTIVITPGGLSPGVITFSNTGARTYVFSGGPIGGSASLVVSGGGSVTLNSVNSYNGGTTVSNGTLNLGIQGAIADNTALTVTGGTLNLGATTVTTTAAVSIRGGVTQNGNIVNNGAALDGRAGTVSASLQGTAGVTKTTTGTLTLGGNNTYTGVTAISEGTVSVGNVVVSGGNSNLGNAASAVVLGDASNQGTLSYTGGPATYTRGFTINAGGGQLTNAGSGLLTVGTGGIDAGGLFTVGGATQNVTISSVISGVGGLTKTGADILTLGGNNSYIGVTTISAGTISAGSIVVGGGVSNLGNATSTVVLGGTSTQGTLSYTGGPVTYTRGFTIGAGGGQLTNAGSGLLTVATGGISAGGLFTVGGATQDITISSAITGTGGLNKTGADKVTLGGTNGYSGGTTVTAGTLSFSSSSNLPVGTVTLAGGTLEFAGSGSAGTYNLIASGGSTYLVNVTNAAGTLTATRTHGNYNGMTKAGVGTLILTNNNQDAGGLQVDAGTVILSGTSTNALFYSTTNTISDVKPGATLKLGNTQVGLIFYDGGTFHMSGGTFDVNGQNPTADQDHSAPVIDNTDAPLGPTSTITNSVGGTTGTALFKVGNNRTFSGNIVDGAGAAKVAITLTSGGSTWTLSGNNTYSGPTTINSGTMQAGSTTAFSPNSAYSVAGSRTLALAGFNNSIGSLTGAGNVTLGAATLTIGNDNTSPAAFTGVISGAGGGIVKIGSGGLTLTGNNTFTGTTTISAGTLSANAIVVGALSAGASSLGNAASAVVLGDGVNKGTLTYTGAVAAYTRGFTINAGGGQITHSGSAGLTIGTGGVAAGGLFTVNVTSGLPTRTVTVSSAITGAGGLTKTGAGTLTLGSASNSYAGDTTVSSGILKLGAANAIPDGAAKGSVSIAGSATFDLNTFSETINGLSGTGGNIVDTVAGGTPTLTVGGNNASSSFSGRIRNSAGTLNLVKVGSGTLTLAGDLGGNGGFYNTYDGATTISAGTISVANLDPSGGVGTDLGFATSAVILGDASNQGTLSYSGGAVSYTRGFTINAGGGQLTNAGTGLLTVSTGAVTANGLFTVGGATQNIAISSVISGSGGVTKTGADTVTLSGANLYNGATTVSNGTLLVTNVTGSGTGSVAVTVASGATLGGTGTATGGITVQNTGTVSPGVSGVGTLNVGGLTFSGSGGTFRAEITAPSTNDRLNVAGTVALGAGIASLVIPDSSPALSLGDRFWLLTNDGADLITGTFAGLAQNATFAVGTNTYRISYNGDFASNTFSIGTGNDIVLEKVTAGGYTYDPDFATTDYPALGGEGTENLDYDNDGLSNLLEYLLNTDPTVDTNAAITHSLVGSVNRISFTRPGAANPNFPSEGTIVYKGQVSSDAINWTDIFSGDPRFVVTNAGQSTETVTITDTGFPTSSNAKRFIRLMVQK